MSAIDNFLSIGLRTRTPGLIMGPPGVGKSASIMSWAAKNNMNTWVVIASLREPTDFAGLPVVSRKSVKDDSGNEYPVVHFAPPKFAAEAAEKGGLIFLDEITTAPPAVQAALLRAVLDLAFGDLELTPGKVAIMAAANPPELSSGGGDLTAPLANRFRHRTYQLDPQAWTESFPSYWGNAPKLGFEKLELAENSWNQARSLVAAFVRTRPTKLLEIPKEETRRGGAWPSPRTWDFASRQLAAIMQDGSGTAEALPYIADCVGEGVAVEFMAWVREVDLPDPWELLKHPDRFKLPSRGDVAFAVLSSVAAAAVNNLTPTVWKAAWQIFGAAAKLGAKDIAASAVKTLAQKNSGALPKITSDILPFLSILKSAYLMLESK